MKQLNFLCPAVLILLATTAQANSGDVQLTDFDAKCGVADHNCWAAFQQAFTALRRNGGGTLHLPEGTTRVQIPGISENMVPNAAKPIPPNTLLGVPPNVTIVGHKDASGQPTSVIDWSNNSVPVFIFLRASNSGMRDVHARFVGSMPDKFPYGDENVLRGLGLNPSYPHLNQLSGGNYELFAFIFVVDSDNCVFDNMILDAAVTDNAHSFGFGFNLKGKGLILDGGQGGLSAQATGNKISNVTLYDFVMGMLISGQDNLTVENIMAGRRASTMAIAPGHVIYTTFQNMFDQNGGATRTVNRGVKIDRISEGPTVHSNLHALGTLAIKAIDGGTISNIRSEHPMGLIHTLYAVRNVTFSHLSWENDYDPCDDTQESCGIDVITAAQTDDEPIHMENLTFSDVTLKSAHRHVGVTFVGSNLTLDGFSIESPAELATHGSPCAICLKNADHVRVLNYNYHPKVTRAGGSTAYAAPLTAFSPSHNVEADVVTTWPREMPRSSAISSKVPDHDPESHNVVRDVVR